MLEPVDLTRATPAVSLNDVGRRYPGPTASVVALEGITLDLARGQLVAITGPSGSGKTTLLNIIAALDRPSSGEVRVTGTAINDLSERERTAFRARGVGLVFQEPHLLPGLSALENVVAAGLPWHPRRVLEIEAADLLAAVGLSERIASPPARLSAGERQRVAVARALLGGRPLLIADEPTGKLDLVTTEALMTLLVGLRDARQLTIVVATHDPAVASYADRVLKLSGGRLVGDQWLTSAPGLEVHELS